MVDWPRFTSMTCGVCFAAMVMSVDHAPMSSAKASTT
jgi:hypothetical protein